MNSYSDLKNKYLDIINYSTLSARDKFEFRSRVHAMTKKEKVSMMRSFVTQLIYTYGDVKTSPDAIEVNRVFEDLMRAESESVI